MNNQELVQEQYGTAPLRERLVEDADEQTTIGRIREERRIGRGLREIARPLDLAGIACRGGAWSHSTVRSILLRSTQNAAGG